MKQVFYKGLLALTIAFGVTSCDKNDVGDSNLQLTAADAKDSNFIHEVKFSETGGFIAPKGKSDSASKNAAEFADSHVYADAAQVLMISNDAGVQYTGSYAAGDISSLDPSEIILGNGSYTAVSGNEDNDGLGIVSGFAPYTSRVSFDLSASASIQLAVTHERGFVIADSERADGGLRITSVVLSQGTGELKVSGNLILDASDDFGDYYGYLEAGTYDVAISYMLDGSAASASGSVEIFNGVASTLAPMLEAETEVSTRVVIGSEDSTEALQSEDVQPDGDMLDIISRVVTTTFTTDASGEDDGVPANGPWMITSNIDVSVSSATVTNTEAGINNPRSLNSDDDMFDLLSRVEITTTTTTDGTAVSVTENGAWTVIEDRSSLGVSEDTSHGDTPPADPADTLSAFSEWSPLTAAVDVATIDQTRTRTIVQNGDLDAVAPVGDLSESRTIDNPDYVAPVDPIDTYTYTDFSGTAPVAVVTSGTAVVTTATAGSEVEFVVQTTTTPQFSTVAAYQLTREATIVQNGDLDDPAPATDALTQDVAEDVTNLDDLVAMVDVMNPAYVAPAAEWANNNGVYSNSDFAGYSFTIEDDLFAGDQANVQLDGTQVDANGDALGLYLRGDSPEAVIAAAKAFIAAQFNN